MIVVIILLDGPTFALRNLSIYLLKMVPSDDPLPFKVFLGYMVYPTETNHIAMTEMPHRGKTQGNKSLCLVVEIDFFFLTLMSFKLEYFVCFYTEERYTWLLDPTRLKGNTGVHYLVVRPIVGPGIKSVNANLSITSITAECKFWNESVLDWSTYGCRVSTVLEFTFHV